MCTVIIAGSRECTDEQVIEEAIIAGIKELDIVPTKFIHGDAPGVDKIGAKICKKLGYTVVAYPAKWNDIKGKPNSEIKENKFGGKYWVKAGFERNQQMANDANALIAVNLGTNGTDDMVRRAKAANLKVYEYNPDLDECFGFNFWDE